MTHTLTAEGFDASEDGTGRGTPLTSRVEQGERYEAAPYDPLPDGPRYAAMGDAVTCSVPEWIGLRLMAALVREGVVEWPGWLEAELAKRAASR